MKRYKILTIYLILLTTVLNAQNDKDWANYSFYKEANKAVKESPVAVFMGNSITQGWYSTRENFFIENNFLGRGIGGQTTYQMLSRFQSDVVDLAPKYVVILAGTNDIARNNGYISNQHIVQNIKSMCEIALNNDIKPIICSVLPVYEYPWRKELGVVASIIVELNDMLRNQAKELGIEYVDYYTKMVDNRGGLPSNLSNDGVHLLEKGYEIMELSILKILKH